MHKNSLLFLITATVFVLPCVLPWIDPSAAHGQTKPGYGFAAVAGEKGGLVGKPV
jgi:hypothetical protein